MESEHPEQAVKVGPHGVKFPTQHERQDVQGQADNEQGDTDVHGKGEQEDVELGKNPGQNAKHQVGDQEQGQYRGAEGDRKQEHVASQVHEQGHRLPGKVESAGGQEDV